jgi:hypothetical protein
MKIVEAYAETVEFIPVAVTVAGTEVTSGIHFAVLPEGSRPITADWTVAYVLEGNSGVLISGLAKGYYHIWVKVTAAPETPVFVGAHLRIK